MRHHGGAAVSAPFVATSRAQGLGASEVAAVLGLSPWMTPWDVYVRKTGMYDQAATTSAQRRGQRLEAAVIDWYAEETGTTIVERGTDYLHPRVGPESWMLATPDAIGVDEAGPLLVEAKTTRRLDGWGQAGTDQVPIYYAAQIAWQLAVVGPGANIGRADLAVYCAISDEFRVYHLRRDRALEDALIGRCRAWWERHVVGGEPPPLDGSNGASVWLTQRFPHHTASMRDATAAEVALLHELRKARAVEQAAGVRRAALEADIKMALGNAEGLSCSAGRVTWRTQRGARRVEIDRLRADHADLIATYTTQAPDTRVLRCTFIEED